MILTSILKRKQSWKKIPVINCLSDESTLSFESNIDEDTNIKKASSSSLEKNTIQCFTSLSWIFQNES